MIPALELAGITKSFDGFLAASAADFEAHRRGPRAPGRERRRQVVADERRRRPLHAGAGRLSSTAKRSCSRGPRDAMAYRIGMVHQHFKLVKPFTALENVLLANPRGLSRRVFARSSAEVAPHRERSALRSIPARRVGELSIAEQQRIEITEGAASAAPASSSSTSRRPSSPTRRPCGF